MQESELAIQIDFIDCLGLGYEVLETLKNHNINLLCIEAKTNQGMCTKKPHFF